MQQVEGIAVPAQDARHGRSEMEDLREDLQLAQPLDRHRAGLAHTPEIVAQHVDDHHVLGAVLGARLQFGAQARVLFGVGPARARALDGPRLDASAAQLEEALRTRRGDRVVRGAQEGRVGSGRVEVQRLGERQRQGRRVGHVDGERPALREIGLEDVARPDALLHALDRRPVFVGGERGAQVDDLLPALGQPHGAAPSGGEQVGELRQPIAGTACPQFLVERQTTREEPCLPRLVVEGADDVVEPEQHLGEAEVVRRELREPLEAPAEVVRPVADHAAGERDQRGDGIARHRLGMESAPHRPRPVVVRPREDREGVGAEERPARPLVGGRRVEQEGMGQVGERARRGQGVRDLDRLDQRQRGVEFHAFKVSGGRAGGQSARLRCPIGGQVLTARRPGGTFFAVRRET